MRKVWTIACREYRAMVATKAFLLSITLMPILMFGGMVVANRLKDVQDHGDKVIVVVDGTSGGLFDELKEAADSRNAQLAATAAESKVDALTGDTSAATAVGPKYVLKHHPAASLSDADRLALSNQIRNDDIEAFVEIPADVMSDDEVTLADAKVGFHSQNAILSEERKWIAGTINDIVRMRRFAELNVSPEDVRRATIPVDVAPLGLFKEVTEGTIRGAGEDRKLASIFMPFGIMMLMFMVIFMSAQPMLESVLEEKSDRIAEVLLGSTSPFQLLLGKLLGNVAGSLSVVTIYAVGGYTVAIYNDWTDLIPLEILPWFLVFQILAVLLFSSVFMAVGAAVSQLKEAQSMLLPVWLLLSSPFFVWIQVVREPNGAIATWLSFFPPATPMLMVVRLASESVIPIWQPVCGLVLLIVTTVLGVGLAARVFRIGILWQGKSPRVRELVRWALSG